MFFNPGTSEEKHVNTRREPHERVEKIAEELKTEEMDESGVPKLH